jgi:hypothetical protein
MATVKLSDEALLSFFQSHPHFRDRVSSSVGAVGNLDADLGEADAAEERLVEEMRLFAAKPGCIARVKKTLLAYEIRRYRGRRAAIQAKNQSRAPLCSRREGQASRVFAAFAAGDRGFRGGHPLCPGRVEIARA